jgi:hypothetical protein
MRHKKFHTIHKNIGNYARFIVKKFMIQPIQIWKGQIVIIFTGFCNIGINNAP